MDGVLEGAVVLSACKLACSLLFLPSLPASHSPVSFCCCCLLIFTDFLVTAVLSFLCALKFWLMELSPPGDLIALRFLLFLSHTYGAVLLLTSFLIAMETLIRVLWPYVAAASRTAGYDGDEEAGSSVLDEGESLPQVVGYVCCLLAWIAVALSVRWRWTLEEEWTAACLDTTESLVRCLPNLFSPMQSVMSPHWSEGFLILLGLLLTANAGRQRRKETSEERKRRQKHEDGWREALDRSTPANFKPVHPEVSTSHCVDGDFVLISRDCLSEKRGRQELAPLAFITGKHFSNQQSLSRWRLWGFPGMEDKAVIGFFSVLSIFTLPFYLSVNVLLIRTIDDLLQGCIKSFLSSIASGRDSPASHKVTQV